MIELVATASAASAAGYQVIALVGGLFGIASLVGAAFAVFRTSMATTTISLLKENNTALQGQNVIQEKTIEDQTHQIKVLEQRVAKLEGENVLLKERVDAKAVLTEVKSQNDRILRLLEGGANVRRSGT